MQHKKYFVAALDNNKKGHNKKFQRNGTSNDFIKVTGRFFRMCETFDYPNEATKNIYEKEKVSITYVNQAIPSMYKLPCFELVVSRDNERRSISIASSILNTDVVVPRSTDIDVTGSRVTSYVNTVECCDIVNDCICPYLTNYFLGEDEFKKWTTMPHEFNSAKRR